MKVTLARGELFEVLSVVSKGTSSRTTLPILSGILLSAAAEKLTLQATDLEISVKASVDAAVERPGDVVAGGRYLSDIVRSLPEGAVTLEVSGDMLNITSGASSFKIKTLPADDFPRFPEVSADRSVDLPSAALSTVVKQISKAVSRDESRPILTGMLMSIDGDRLKMVATDSYRLAINSITLDSPIDEPLQVVVPGKALEEVAKMASSSEKVSFGYSDNQTVFSFGDVVYVTRRIDGNYPNYSQLLPDGHETRVTVSREELMDTVRRVGVMAQNNAPLRVQAKCEDQTLSLSASTQDVGEASDDVHAGCEGKDVEIAFNPAFLIDGIASATEETIAIEMTSPLKPAVIKNVGSEEFVYLLMPVRI